MSDQIRSQAEQEIRRIIEEMRSERSRYKSHDLGYVDSVSSSRVDEWADELESLLLTLAARDPRPDTFQMEVTQHYDGPQPTEPTLGTVGVNTPQAGDPRLPEGQEPRK